VIRFENYHLPKAILEGDMPALFGAKTWSIVRKVNTFHAGWISCASGKVAMETPD
jgi:hypothetical protein